MSSSTDNLKLGTELNIPISRLALGGDSVGTLPDGRVCFVRGAPLGTHIQVRLTRLKKRFARGELIQQPPSKHCDDASKCGGCPWHLSSQTVQRDELLQHVARAAVRLQWNGTPQLPIWRGVSTALGWRRTARWNWLDRDLGYFSWNTHDVIVPSRCSILVQNLERARLILVKGFEQFGDGQGTIRATCDALGKVYLSLQTDRTNGTGCLLELCEWLVASVNDLGGLELMAGDEVLFRAGQQWYPIGRWQIPHSIGAFVQANEAIHDNFVEYVVSKFEAEDRVLELFSGSGSFTVPLLEQGCEVHAIEGESRAVNRLNATAKKWIEGGQLRTEAKRIDAMPDGNYDACLLDPPRAGAAAFISQVCSEEFRKIVYVSCDFGTLVRDLKTLNEAGYFLDEVSLFEMFPHSGHLECVVSLTPCDR